MDTPTPRTPASVDPIKAKQDARLDSLRQAWQLGAESGDAGPLDFVVLRSEARRKQAASRQE